jgi:AcrR family transcriptional regulator
MDNVHTGRPRVPPDPEVRAKILAAALEIVQEHGIDALGVSQVLARTQLSTRAFYRHFDTKEALVTAMFLEVARAEMQRLQPGMADKDPVSAVVGWIDGRLDFAFNPEVQYDSRHLSLEAHAQIFAAPELVGPAYAQILRPLIEQLDRGGRMGLFADGHPAEEAMSIHGVVWSNIEAEWATGTSDLAGLRRRVVRFCLRGLGVAADVIAEIIADEKSVNHN